MRRPALGETRERDCQAALPLGCEVIARLHGLITPHITAHQQENIVINKLIIKN